MFSHHETTLCY